MVEQDTAQVAFTETRKHHYDQLPGIFRTLADLDGGEDGGPGGDAHEQAFFDGETPGHEDGVFAGDLDDLGNVVGAEDFGNEAGADALNFMRAGSATRKDCAFFRFDCDGLEARLFRTDVFGHAGDGAAGADTGDEDIDLAVGVFPDFRAGGFEVNLRVCGIGELLQHVAIGRLRKNLVGLDDGGFHAFGA